MVKHFDAEAAVLRHLERQAQPGDVILQGVRFADPKNGDVEADFLVLIPEMGVAAIEVKGGHVTYQDGEWKMTGIEDPKYSRRIHPVKQARGAKHALRRYLDRQPEWTAGLIRSAWFVVIPETEVRGDFGPEGTQDHLIGSDEMADLRGNLIMVLDRSLDTDPRPSVEALEDVVSLLLRSDNVSIRHMGRPGRQVKPWRRRPAILIGATAGVLALLGLGLAGITGNLTSEQCSPNYQPCIPIADDLDCAEVGVRVTVVGTDDYGLDRDGNGIGCESFG